MTENERDMINNMITEQTIKIVDDGDRSHTIYCNRGDGGLYVVLWGITSAVVETGLPFVYIKTHKLFFKKNYRIVDCTLLNDSILLHTVELNSHELGLYRSMRDRFTGNSFRNILLNYYRKEYKELQNKKNLF